MPLHHHKDNDEGNLVKSVHAHVRMLRTRPFGV